MTLKNTDNSDDNSTKSSTFGNISLLFVCLYITGLIDEPADKSTMCHYY